MEPNAVASKTAATLADYMALDEPDGPRYELDEGRLIVSPSTTWEHNDIRDLLNAQLRVQLAKTGAGRVTSETDFLLSPSTVRRPDLAIVFAANYQRAFRRQLPIPIPPDIAIEIVSPSEREPSVRRTTLQYLLAGTHVVWLLYPEVAHRWDCTAAAAPIIRTINENWDEPQLLPGVTVPFRDVFPQE